MGAAGIPRAALWLGLAGLLPFIWGAGTTLMPELGDAAREALGQRMVGPYVQLFYGMVILSFMSGVLWGFATRAEAGEIKWYGLSVIPALWAFFMTGGGPYGAGLALIAGFAGLLGLDWLYWRAGLTPEWWMALRVPLTAVVIACLMLGVMVA
ncbi:DUF3429 domain-containing protein [Marimonas lutisalis]|uniref:DUF3429 domain-containing protein n=1 Tax=Marimonas lutisalis TaxID=2545756 RepID=UPI0010F52254|nr:DUF3429 domain-containing protein [Marimonas lutisalis]